MELKSKLVDLFPYELVKRFASPYIAGDNLVLAIGKAKELYNKKGLLSSIDILGEEVKDKSEAMHNLSVYQSIADAIESKFSTVPLMDWPTISTKPSSLTTTLGKNNEFFPDIDLYTSNLESLVKHSLSRAIDLTIDMEGSRWTDITLDSYFKLINHGFVNLGTVIQTRLNRTAEDIKRFDEGTRVRMCIGIYNEPKDFATSSKPVMKERMLAYSKVLLDRKVYVEFATHDSNLIKRFFNEIIIPNKIPNNRYEIQMLLGVPREKEQSEIINGGYFPKKDETLNDLRDNGVNVRLYVPFGETWDNAIAYAKRRLKGNPDFWKYGASMAFGKLIGK